MKNKLIYTLLMCFTLISLTKAQKHEVGIGLGLSSFVGDIGRTGYILQKPFNDFSQYVPPIYAGVLYRYNLNSYQTLRLNVAYTDIQFDDAYTKEDYRKKRKEKGTNSIIEVGALFEYNFLPVNEERKSLLSPYVFGGVSGLFMKSSEIYLTINSATDIKERYEEGKAFTMAIPFGVGLKYKFNYNWAISGEFTFRPTFSDKVDYSHYDREDIKIKSTKLDEVKTEAVIENYIKKKNVGNPNSKDWVNSAAIILTYSFGRPPCYCN